MVPLFLLTEVALAKGDLFGRGVARECSAEKRVHQRGLVGRIVRQKFPREIAGLAGDEIAVEQRQRLRGDSGHRTSTNRTLGSAVVEHLEKRYHHRPLHEGVNAAARLLIGPGVAPAAARLGGAGDHFAAEVRIKSAAAHRGVERVAGPENGIANGLGLETAKVLAPDQLVAGIGGLVGRILPRSVAVSVAVHDHAVHMLDRPATVDELRRQPVEQCRVGAGHAGLAEVVRRRDEPAPEVELPNAIGHHAGGQRMPGAGDPLGQGEPAAGRERVGRLLDGRLVLGQDLEEFRLNLFAGASGVAADQQVRVHRLGAVFAHGHRVLTAVPRRLGVLRFVLPVLPRKNLPWRDERRVGGGVPLVLGLVIVADVAEEREHLVVVLLRDGIEHVIMATRAANRQAHEGFRGGLEHVVEPFELGGARVVRFVIPDAEPVKTGGDQAVIVHVRQLVAGDLLHHEPVVRLVLVERADDVVAVFPDKRFFIVALVAVGLGEAHDVEPVAAPAFAVLR